MPRRQITPRDYSEVAHSRARNARDQRIAEIKVKPPNNWKGPAVAANDCEAWKKVIQLGGEIDLTDTDHEHLRQRAHVDLREVSR